MFHRKGPSYSLYTVVYSIDFTALDITKFPQRDVSDHYSCFALQRVNRS